MTEFCSANLKQHSGSSASQSTIGTRENSIDRRERSNNIKSTRRRRAGSVATSLSSSSMHCWAFVAVVAASAVSITCLCSFTSAFPASTINNGGKFIHRQRQDTVLGSSGCTSFTSNTSPFQKRVIRNNYHFGAFPRRGSAASSVTNELKQTCQCRNNQNYHGTTPTSLRMSSIEQEEPKESPPTAAAATANERSNGDDAGASSVNSRDRSLAQRRTRSNNHRRTWRDYLPPPPEDKLTLSGDVASLFVYSFLDHTMNDLYVHMVNKPDMSASTYASSFDPSLLGDMATVQHLPVWFDPIHSAFGPILSAALPVNPTVYAPAISSAGMGAIVMSTCWILAGCITDAFAFRNTLNCNTRHALFVTGRTWLFAAVMMVALALGSDAVTGWYDAVHTPSLGGLTKADADYIFDSLSVLVTWRFVLSWLFGGGR